MERKTETIIVRVTKSTKENLIKKANKLGVKLSEFIRSILNDKN